MDQNHRNLTGGCACGKVRYRLNRSPLFVHCCHCGECQRETGSAFAVNALIEGNAVHLDGDKPEPVALPTASGNPHTVLRCPTCKTAVWSEYSSGNLIAFIRVGTLDTPDLSPPDIHIFTNYKQDWVQIPDQALAVPEFYNFGEVWPQSSLDRLHSVFHTPPAP